MTSCPRCGAALAPDHRFCGDCGAPVLLACQVCKTPVPTGDRFCRQCGATVAPAGSGSDRASVPSGTAVGPGAVTMGVTIAISLVALGLARGLGRQAGLSVQPHVLWALVGGGVAAAALAFAMAALARRRRRRRHLT